MNTHYNLLRELLDHLDDFQANSSNPDDMRDFVLYLKEKTFGPESKQQWKDRNDYSKPENVNTKDVAEVEFSTLVAILYRFAKGYIKKAFEKTSFKTIDEFGFMASIFKEGSLLKSEVIHLHRLEISSGSEIIKRLIKLELIEEKADEHDKRARRISLTPKGQYEIIMAFQEMNKVSKVVSGNLSSQELNDTIFILNKLKVFHEDIHEHDKGQEIEFILGKYC